MDPASAIAGLIGLGGVTVQAAAFLHNFCVNYRGVSREVDETSREIADFRACLEHIVTAPGLERLRPSTVQILKETLSVCKMDLDLWVSEIRALHPKGKTRINKVKAKIKGAVEYGRFSELRLKVSSHKGQLLQVQALVNRELSVCGLNKMHELQQSQGERHLAQSDSLRRIETGVEQLNQSRSSVEDMAKRLQHIEETFISSVISSRGDQDIRPRARTAALRRRGYVKAVKALHPSTQADSSTSRDSLQDDQYLLRIVDTSLVIRNKLGQPSFSLLAEDDPVFQRADYNEKLRMILQIRQLRLALWLLEKYCIPSQWSNGTTLGRGSPIRSNGSLVCSYELMELPGFHWNLYLPRSSPQVPNSSFHLASNDLPYLIPIVNRVIAHLRGRVQQLMMSLMDISSKPYRSEAEAELGYWEIMSALWAEKSQQWQIELEASTKMRTVKANRCSKDVSSAWPRSWSVIWVD